MERILKSTKTDLEASLKKAKNHKLKNLIQTELNILNKFKNCFPNDFWNKWRPCTYPKNVWENFNDFNVNNLHYESISIFDIKILWVITYDRVVTSVTQLESLKISDANTYSLPEF